MNMADQERQHALRNGDDAQQLPGIFSAANPLEQISARLEKQGYFPKLSKIPRAWQCTLFREGGKSETPPSGRGETALAALQAAARELGPSAFF